MAKSIERSLLAGLAGLLSLVLGCGRQPSSASASDGDAGNAVESAPDASSRDAGSMSGFDGAADTNGSPDGSAVSLSPDASGSLAPTGLLCELLSNPQASGLTDNTPEFAWIVNAARSNERQTAYQILVASRPENLNIDTGDLWDSGKILSSDSVNVAYAGHSLAPGASYFWKVRTWDSLDEVSPWSNAQQFVMAASLGQYATATAPLAQTPIAPTQVVALAPGHYFVDFGLDAFGWVELTLDAPADGTVVNVLIGEKANGQSVDPNPGGTIRYAASQVTLQKGPHTYRVTTPKDTTNTNSPAVLLPSSIGVVMPFRYVEVINSPVNLGSDTIRQVAVHYPFEASASSFRSSDDKLNQVWNLSRYSIMATTFTGTYVDGDRERTPYEADAYIQQLGHYGVDREFALARYSHEYLLVHPTWPTEWKQHSVMMAWTDWMYTGNTESLAQWYTLLTTQKTLEQYVGADGLLNTHGLRDIVDWPAGERDGFVFADVNTIVNAFFCHNSQQMAGIAAALGNASEAARYRAMASLAIASLNAKLSDPNTGLYLDGEGTTHSSLHANMFPLAFGLVPADRKARVVSFVESRGMACSAYGAQYLLEGLFQAGEADAALALMTSETDRSWMNMLRVGSTITMEAWDIKYKPNLDWNHVWGAAPANIVPRYLLGVQPLEPGYPRASIHPQPGSLSHIEGTVPTIRGPITVVVDRSPFAMGVEIPANMTANIALPSAAGSPCNAVIDGQPAALTVRDGSSFVDSVGSGHHDIRCQ